MKALVYRLLRILGRRHPVAPAPGSQWYADDLSARARCAVCTAEIVRVPRPHPVTREGEGVTRIVPLGSVYIWIHREDFGTS